MKTPKIYFADVGLAAHLLNITSSEQMSRNPLFEDFNGGKVIYVGSRAGYLGIDFVNFAET